MVLYLFGVVSRINLGKHRRARGPSPLRFTSFNTNAKFNVGDDIAPRHFAQTLQYLPAQREKLPLPDAVAHFHHQLAANQFHLQRMRSHRFADRRGPDGARKIVAAVGGAR